MKNVVLEFFLKTLTMRSIYLYNSFFLHLYILVYNKTDWKGNTHCAGIISEKAILPSVSPSIELKINYKISFKEAV